MVRPAAETSAMRLIGVVVAEHLGDVVLVLEQEAVERPAGGAVQLDPRRGQDLLGATQASAGRSGRPAGAHRGPRPAGARRRAGRRGPPSAPVPRERRRRRAAGGARRSAPRARRATCPRGPSPGIRHVLEHRARHPVVAPDEAGVEKAEGDPDVVLGGLGHLPGLADAVVETDALVPHGIPDGVGDGRDVTAPVVERARRRGR